VAERQALVPLEVLKARALAQPSAVDGVRALCGLGVGVIGGLPESDPAMAGLAGEYELGGAAAVSVPIGAGGSAGRLRVLREVGARVQVPVLCDDLVISSYQLWEARAHGADFVLLLVAALEQHALVSLVERADSLGMCALVEVRDESELLRAAGAGARVITVNVRDHATGEVDAAAGARLIPLIPAGIVRVAECGGTGRVDLIACARAGVDAVKVGARVLAGNNPRAAIAALVAIGSHPALSGGARQAA
jgi:indole-3-glycerol phosphate synthase